ncbi:hypothetical protein BV898_00713 [Hypsibius exemplaris]|uniref:Uncharacterized protein n=1 Tax=Hypsibius exemplaris TaxID=2072580 RepID=A0A1W0XEG2_HYPEX|nr:hypothetical protein BV898_00713 [Hypsibius exemplaris]
MDPSDSSASSSTPIFLAVTRTTLPQYAEQIKNALRRSSAVSLAVHSTVGPTASQWRAGESQQEYYRRLTSLGSDATVFGLGISCAEAFSSGDDEKRRCSIKIRNFHFTFRCAGSGHFSSADVRLMRKLGYDPNYVLQEGAYYCRGAVPAACQGTDVTVLRDILAALCGSTIAHPVVVNCGFLDLILACSALSGVPPAGDGLEELLQNLFHRFPGKIVDLAVKASTQTPVSIAVPVTFPCDEDVKTGDVFALGDPQSVDLKQRRGLNLRHPAALDSFRSLAEFLRRLRGDLSEDSLAAVVDSYGNRVRSVDGPQAVCLQSVPVREPPKSPVREHLKPPTPKRVKKTEEMQETRFKSRVNFQFKRHYKTRKLSSDLLV